MTTSFGWGKGWNVTSAGWQVTLCDLIWHVNSSSGVATSVSQLVYPCYLPCYHRDPKSNSLCKNMSYDSQIVKICPPIFDFCTAHHFTQAPNPQSSMLCNAFQLARHPKSAPFHKGIYTQVLPGPSRLSIINCISSGSAAFAQVTA